MVIGGVNQTIIEEDINAIDDGEDGVEDHMYNSVMVDNIGAGAIGGYGDCFDGSMLDRTTDQTTPSRKRAALNTGAQTQRNTVLHQD